MSKKAQIFPAEGEWTRCGSGGSFIIGTDTPHGRAGAGGSSAAGSTFIYGAGGGGGKGIITAGSKPRTIYGSGWTDWPKSPNRDADTPPPEEDPVDLDVEWPIEDFTGHAVAFKSSPGGRDPGVWNTGVISVCVRRCELDDGFTITILNDLKCNTKDHPLIATRYMPDPNVRVAKFKVDDMVMRRATHTLHRILHVDYAIDEDDNSGEFMYTIESYPMRLGESMLCEPTVFVPGILDVSQKQAKPPHIMGLDKEEIDPVAYREFFKGM